jgi:drug/metabolite transporter (DMT)-like permease
LNDLAMAFVVLVWGTNISVLKAALAAFPAPAFMALRFFIAACAMGLLLLARREWPSLPRAAWVRLVLLGLVGNTLYQLLFIFGVSRTSASSTGMMVAATPVVVTLVGAQLGYETLTRPLVFGVLAGVVGLLLVVSGGSLLHGSLLGDGLVLGSTLCWSAYTLGVRSLRDLASPLQITAVSMLIGTPLLLLFGAPSLAATDWAAIPGSAWAGLAFSSLLALVVSYVLWAGSIRNVGGSRTALYNCAIPVVATLTAWVALDERPSLVQLGGAGLIIGGIVLTRR